MNTSKHLGSILLLAICIQPCAYAADAKAPKDSEHQNVATSSLSDSSPVTVTTDAATTITTTATNELASQPTVEDQIFKGYEAKITKGKGEEVRTELEKGKSSARAKCLLGKLYFEGIGGVEKNTKHGIKLLKKAHAEGSIEATSYLHILSYQGKIGPNASAINVEYIQKRADEGIADSQYQLGNLYANGEYVDQDFAKAITYLEKAAAQKHVNSMFILGVLYSENVDFPHDFNKARYWFEQAASNGHSFGVVALADMLSEGTGGNADYPRAQELFEKGIKMGNAAGYIGLGNMYRRGKLGAPDYAKAERCFTSAAILGRHDAEINLAEMYRDGEGRPRDLKKAYELYQKSAEKGNKYACATMGLFSLVDKWEEPARFKETLALVKDEKKAVKWLQRASDKDYEFAHFKLGECLENGIGVPKDVNKAAKFYLKAKKQGEIRAEAAINHMVQSKEISAQQLQDLQQEVETVSELVIHE